MTQSVEFKKMVLCVEARSVVRSEEKVYRGLTNARLNLIALSNIQPPTMWLVKIKGAILRGNITLSNTFFGYSESSVEKQIRFRSHGLRGNAVKARCAANHDQRPAYTRRSASCTAFPRGAWERVKFVPIYRRLPISLLFNSGYKKNLLSKLINRQS
jgi:hypothetical protein